MSTAVEELQEEFEELKDLAEAETGTLGSEGDDPKQAGTRLSGLLWRGPGFCS